MEEGMEEVMEEAVGVGNGEVKEDWSWTAFHGMRALFCWASLIFLIGKRFCPKHRCDLYTVTIHGCCLCTNVQLNFKGSQPAVGNQEVGIRHRIIAYHSTSNSTD